MAVVRRAAAARVILSSATPSVESRNNADIGRYRHVVLHSRFAEAALPDITAIDMREEPPDRGQWIAPRLAREVFAALDRGEQALLFLNRRGYAPLTLCRACGHQYQCPDCDAWLVEHRFRGVLMCHHCGHEQKRPESCGHCGAVDSLVAVGPGIERIAEEAERRFPDARKVILSSDMGSHAQLRERFAEIERGEYDLIIGTQLVAKGHHFEKLTLVGVLDADLGLAHGDPRAAERTFQILTQVTGRAGRAARHGRAFLQTYHPGHPVIAAMVKGDREAFYAHELKVRAEGQLPPFGRLAALIVTANAHEEAMGHAKRLLSAAPMAEGLRLYGPADAPLSMICGRHRVRSWRRAPRLRPFGLCAVLAAERRAAAGQREGAGGHRSAELFLGCRGGSRPDVAAECPPGFTPSPGCSSRRAFGAVSGLRRAGFGLRQICVAESGRACLRGRLAHVRGGAISGGLWRPFPSNPSESDRPDGFSTGIRVVHHEVTGHWQRRFGAHPNRATTRRRSSTWLKARRPPTPSRRGWSRSAG